MGKAPSEVVTGVSVRLTVVPLPVSREATLSSGISITASLLLGFLLRIPRNISSRSLIVVLIKSEARRGTLYLPEHLVEWIIGESQFEGGSISLSTQRQFIIDPEVVVDPY